jgi:peptidylprolyl isomerase
MLRSFEVTATAKTGDKVTVHFTGKLNDGKVFDSSREQDPIEFVVGQKAVIAGLDNAVAGMAPGEQKTVQVPSAQAYGPHLKELLVEFPRDRIPENFFPEVGQRLQVRTSDGRTMPAVVVDANDAAVTVDANHPLAGKDLTFDIELVNVVESR